MKYLVIENAGECDFRAFTLLGVSNARGEKGKIGQFGSGAKHAMLIAMRAELDLAIVSGQTVVRPQTEETFVNNRIYAQVFFDVTDIAKGTKNKYESSMTLDFGELDWSIHIPMMIRELVSNALDAVDQKWEDISVYIANEISPENGKTKVYVELRSDVRKEYAHINDIFLHASGQEKETLIPIEGETRCAKIYRKGVFVRKLDSGPPALFDYNCDDKLQIDESRKYEGMDVLGICAQTLFDWNRQGIDKVVENTKRVLQAGLAHGKHVFEHDFNYWRIDSECTGSAMKALYGEKVVITNLQMLLQQGMAKGIRAIYFPPAMKNWYENAARSCKRLEDILDVNVARFRNKKEISCPIGEKLISWLAANSFIDTETKRKPQFFSYQGIAEGGALIRGYSDGTDVYLSHEDTENVQTILEELLHHYTGADDYTRDFQEITLNVASKLLKDKLSL